MEDDCAQKIGGNALFWSLIAPEIVMLWAMRQWVGARKVEKKYRGEYCPQPHLVSLLT